jgi:hypothetical protein
LNTLAKFLTFWPTKKIRYQDPEYGNLMSSLTLKRQQACPSLPLRRRRQATETFLCFSLSEQENIEDLFFAVQRKKVLKREKTRL